MANPINLRAFPSNAIDPKYGGMELRDWFAGQVAAGMATACDQAGIWQTIGAEENIAIHAYNVAQAMLVERAKRNEVPTSSAFTSAAELLFNAGYLAHSDVHRIVNRIRAAENVREGEND